MRLLYIILFYHIITKQESRANLKQFFIFESLTQIYHIWFICVLIMSMFCLLLTQKDIYVILQNATSLSGYQKLFLSINVTKKR